MRENILYICCIKYITRKKYATYRQRYIILQYLNKEYKMFIAKNIEKGEKDMAGFFGFFDYTKPGPGISKDEPPKPRIVVFFEIYQRKFWNLIKINLMFLLFNLPAIVAAMIATQFLIQKTIMGDLGTDMTLRFIISLIFLCIPIITVGPAQAGFTYLLRNYAREEHAFLWSDFKEHALKNLKQSLIISIIDFAVVLLVSIDINVYLSIKGTNNLLVSVASGLLILAFIIYAMMHMYMYPLLVTFKLTIKQLYKNALIFAMIRFIPNLLILILCIGLILASFYNIIIGFILFPFITVSTIGLITNFFVYPTIKKHIIDKMESSGL